MKMEHKLNRANEEIERLRNKIADEIAFHKWVISRARTLKEIKEASNIRLGVIVKNGKK